MTRRFTAELAPFIGPQLDIPAPDMATNEQTMAWMMDTYSMQKGYAVPEIVTGKPISIGGSLFRHEATGAGVVMVRRACLPAARLGPRRAALCRAGLRQRRRDRRDRAARQGRDGRSRVSDISGGVHRAGRARHPDAARVRRRARIARGLRARGRRAHHERGAARARVRHPRARRARGSGHGRERRQPPLPAASPRARTGRRRSKATAILAERGIPVLPDILTNAGGVTVSYFEWVQDLGRLFWDRDEIRRRLADKMSDAFDRVWNVVGGARHLSARRRARRRDPRGLRRARGARRLSVSR